MDIAGINIDVGTVFSGIGQLAKDIRTAWTGQEPIDANKAAELAMQASALEVKVLEIQNGLYQAQTAVNLKEAESTSIFVAGWRPFVGWVCGSAYAYNYVVGPLVHYIGKMYDPAFPPPIALDLSELSILLLGMLGIGGFRTFEKVKGVAKVK